MQTERRVAANLQTKPIDLGCYYYSARKLILCLLTSYFLPTEVTSVRRVTNALGKRFWHDDCEKTSI